MAGDTRLFDGEVTGKSLTEMLREKLCDIPPESQAQADADEWELSLIKDTFKEWLGKIGIAHQLSEESTRQLLITLVDEP